MKITQAIHALAGLLFTASVLAGQAAAQANQTQQLAFAGLRAVSAQGQFNAVKSDAAGNLYLLLDQGDGVRILKTDNAGGAVLAQTLLGAQGDTGVAMALDPSGNVYVAGTTTSNALTATSGAAIPARTDTSTNSFVAKFDANLNPLFVTFTGGSKIVASAIAATSDAVFVTGSLFSATLPAGTSGFQQATANGSFQNGFVEKFSSTGSTLLYATYLTGASGDTTPTVIAADASDSAYVAGATTSASYPTASALVPVSVSNPSGFLTRITPAGDGISFSTFIPGQGLSSIALDTTGKTLLLSGSIALGQFPVDTVNTPLLPLNYQVLLRMPLDGNAIQSSMVIAPGQQSFVVPTPDGSVWVDGTFTAPLLPAPALASLGTGYAVHVNAQNVIDQTARFGGLPDPHATFASLPAVITSIALDPAGEPLIAGSMQPTASSALLATETYDLPLVNNLTAALPSTIRAAEMTAATCNGSLCAGSGAYLAKLNVATSAPSLVFSTDDSPWLVLRNLGSAQANGLQLTATGATLTTNCGTSLAPGGECDALLSGGGAATITAGSTNAASQSVSVPAFTAPATTIVYFPKELDFGVQTSASAAATRVITVSNLGTASLNFTSAIDSAAKTASPFTEQSSDCAINGGITAKVLAAGATCHITLAFTASSIAANDGLLNAAWSIGSRDVVLTGYSQAASLSVSATKIDFGTQYTGGIQQPRYVYLSNNSSVAIAHVTATLAMGSPFTVTDACPTSIAAGTECRLRVDYLSKVVPSADSTTLTLDQGLSVLLTGQTQAAPVTGAPAQNSNLSVAPASVTFPSSVVVTGVSGTNQTVSISNSGTAAFSLAFSLSGDFTDITSCGATLAGGQTCAVSLTFVPTQTGLRQGLLAVTAGGASPVYVVLNGTGTAILPSSSSSTMSLGSQPLGQPSAQFFKVAQAFTSLTASASGPFGVALIADTGTGPGQPPTTAYASTVTGACPNCYLAVQFLPTAAGVQSGVLTLSSVSGGAPYSIALTGTGVSLAGMLLTPATKDLGSVPVGSTSSATIFTLTNASNTAASVTLSAPVVSGDFAVTTTALGGQVCGNVLAFTASCVFGMQFTPSAIGTRSGSVSLATSDGSVVAALSGYGTGSQGLAINPLALTFNNISGATATRQTLTLSNTGNVALAINAPTAGTASFQASSACSSLAVGASCTVTVTFIPGAAAVLDTLSIPVVANGGSTVTTYTVALSGTYTASSAGLSLSPLQTNFGPTAVAAQGAARQFTVSNLSGKSVAVNVVVPRQFALTGPPCVSLAANANCTINLQFVPLTNGDITGTLIVNAAPSDGSASSQSISYVEGYGTSQAGALTITGGLQTGNLLNFGQVTSGQTATRTLTLTNASASDAPPINIRRITSGPPFLSTTTCKLALSGGQSCTVLVTYAPLNQVAAGASSPASSNDTGVLTLESDASSSPDIINIAGQAGPVASSSPVGADTLATFAASQGSFSFPATLVGTATPAQSLTLTNSGNVPMHLVSATTTADFTVQNTCATLLPGASCSLTVAFTPQTQGTHIAALELATDSTASLEFISLIGTASPQTLTLTPASLDFGSLAVGASASLSALLTNTASTAATISSIATTGDYKMTGNCPAPGGTLAASSSCSLQIVFTPTQTGVRPGSLSVTTPVSTVPLTTTLTGTGIQSQLTVNPAKLDFGSVTAGTPSKLSLTLSNTGTAPITNLALAVNGDYAITIPCLSATLAAGDICTLQITFTPAAAGTRTGTLTITSSDRNSPQSVSLTGTGVASPSFTLTANGANSASATVKSGSPATYSLTVTPTGGFTGPVALTCAAIAAGPYASCSLQPSTLTLNSAALSATATINTITTTAQLDRPAVSARVLLCLLVPGMVLLWTRRRIPAQRLLGLLLAVFALGSGGCGGASSAVQPPPSNILNTPPGTYQYQVTASSTSGTPITQSITLNLTVQ